MRTVSFWISVSVAFAGVAIAETPAQPQILWTMEHGVGEVSPNQIPDYRPNDPSSYYRPQNPFLLNSAGADPTASPYGGENPFLGGGSRQADLLDSLGVMGGAFSPDSLYTTDGNAFIQTSQAADSTSGVPEMSSYYNMVDNFLTGTVPAERDPWLME